MSGSEIICGEWCGCYESGWGGLISPQSYAHPAKMAHGLLSKILEYGFEQGWWEEGWTILDPFGGVGSTGLLCSYRGLRSVSVELETKFYRLAVGYDCPGEGDVCPACEADNGDKWLWEKKAPHHFEGNFERHRRAWESQGLPLPVMVQGDSRKLPEVLADAVVSSPPYADQVIKDRDIGKEGFTQGATQGKHAFDSYGTTPGQIGRMKSGSVEAVVSSPPYAESIQGGGTAARIASGAIPKGALERVAKWDAGGGIYGSTPGQIGNMKSGQVDGVLGSPPFSQPGSQPCGNLPSCPVRSKRKALGLDKKSGQEYGKTDGNIGSMKSGTVDGVVSSPPYEDSPDKLGKIDWTKTRHGSKKAAHGSGHCSYADGNTGGYGRSPGQIGNTNGSTYWEAVRDVYAACRQVLKPGGVACFVVKDYVRGGQRVRLCDDTMKLLVSLGFVPVARIRAMLKKEWVENCFHGEETKSKKRNSFFRKLAEANVQAAIHWDTLSREEQNAAVVGAKNLQEARKKAWEAAGQPAYESECIIDYEEVLVVRAGQMALLK